MAEALLRITKLPANRLGPAISYEDQPSHRRLCGTSSKWLCAYCGEAYAETRCFIERRLQPFTFYNGCCPDCSGHRCSPPGGMLRYGAQDFSRPEALLRRELEVELSFLSHPDHPHNKEYS